MKKLGLIVLLLGIMPFLSQVGWTEEIGTGTSEEERVVSLEPVVVTAFPLEAVTITPRKTIIDVEKFTQASRTERIQDVLQRFAGIDRMRRSATPDPEEMVFLRGFDDSRFMVTIDERPITGPSGDQDSFVDWSTLITDDIAKIEIIRSGSSVLYDNSQGGIINLIRKKGKKYETLMPKIHFLQDYGRFTNYASRLTADGGAGPLTYFIAGAKRGSDEFVRNSDYNDYDLSMRGNILIPGGGNVTLAWKRSEYKSELPVVNDVVYPGGVTFPNLPDYNPDFPTVPADAEVARKFRGIAYPGGDSFEKKKVDYVDFILEQPIYKGTLKAQFYRSESDETFDELQITGGIFYIPGVAPVGAAAPALNQNRFAGPDLNESTIGSILRYNVPLWEANSLTAGWDFRKMETEASTNLIRLHAGYFEDIWGITDKLTLTAGLRYVHLREYGQQPSERIKTKNNLWLPKGTVEYRFTPNTSVFFSANRDYRIPGC
jgi:outer membrane receptor protein involved in Fe transport